MKFATIPAWALPRTPSARSLFEVIALAGLEGKEIRLNAAAQRAIMGAPVFGKLAIKVTSEGEVITYRSVCFGADCAVFFHTLADIEKAVAIGALLGRD